MQCRVKGGTSFCTEETEKIESFYLPFHTVFSIHLTETGGRKKERVILKKRLVALSVSDGVTDDSAEITPTGLQSVLPFESGV